MAAVLQFRNDIRRSRPDGIVRPAEASARKGEVVIFPGVRIERAEIDLAHRLVQVSQAGEGASGQPAGKS
jgi:hypothetical protein